LPWSNINLLQGRVIRTKGGFNLPWGIVNPDQSRFVLLEGRLNPGRGKLNPGRGIFDLEQGRFDLQRARFDPERGGALPWRSSYAVTTPFRAAHIATSWRWMAAAIRPGKRSGVQAKEGTPRSASAAAKPAW
jgi:hypothetical protein